MPRYLYSELSALIDARKRCELPLKGTFAERPKQASEWFDRHTDTIERLVREHMPGGSGYDSGTKLDLDRSHGDKLVFTTAPEQGRKNCARHLAKAETYANKLGCTYVRPGDSMADVGTRLEQSRAVTGSSETEQDRHNANRQS